MLAAIAGVPAQAVSVGRALRVGLPGDALWSAPAPHALMSVTAGILARGRSSVMAALLACTLGACILTPVTLPSLSPSLETPVESPLPGWISQSGQRALKRVLVVAPVAANSLADAVPAEPPARGRLSGKHVGLNDAPLETYRVGARTFSGVVVTPDLARAYEAWRAGEFDAMLAAADEAAREGDPKVRWTAETLRFEALLMLGRGADAETVALQLATLERALLGHDAVARAMRGLARMTFGDRRGALADFGHTARVIGGWSLPVSYSGPPSNIFELSAVAGAQLRAYSGLATVYFLEGDYRAAERWAQAAEGLFQDNYYVFMHPLYGPGRVMPEAAEGRAFTLAILGASRAILRRDPAAGEAELNEALIFFRAHGQRFGEATVLALRAEALHAAGRPAAAEAQLREAEALAAASGLGDQLWYFAYRRGTALLAYGHRDQAEAAFRKAQDAIELAIGALAGGASKLRFGAGKEAVARQLIEFDLARGDLAALFRDLERARARAFVDLLANVTLARGSGNERAAAIRALDRRILRARLRAGTTGVADATEEAALLAERRRLIGALRAEDAALADTLSVAHAELSGIQSRLGSEEALLYVLPPLRDGRIRFLFVTPRTARLLERATTHERLADAVRRLARAAPGEAATAPSMARGPRLDPIGEGKAQQEARARAIADLVGLPAFGKPAMLYVVPSGAVHFVPWGALEVRYPVVTLPTAAWLERAGSRPSGTRRAVILGDPEFHGVFAPLPGAREEARSLGRLYSTEPLLGAQASEVKLREQVGAGADALHLATHGYFDNERPLASGLILSGTGRPAVLTAQRLFEAPVSARLVVLSACETGVGEAVAGDDLLGLPRSFYLGGARAVVSSLWPVEDESTRLFMEVFHRQARDGDYATAWLAARDHLRARGYPPSAYGAFQLGGAPRG